MSEPANSLEQQTEKLVGDAIAWLGQRLPATWRVGRSQRTVTTGADATPQVWDAGIEIAAAGGAFGTLVVDARTELSPRDVEGLLSSLARSLRALAGNAPILVVAPWLSARTRQLLEEEGINFLDLTGNALIRLDNPALFVQSVGADRNPQPASRGPARLRGAKAARLVRLLADVRPPYGVRELASAVELNPGYVSRLLDALDREALIERDPRGPVRAVSVSALLRRLAESYDVFKSNATTTYLARTGAADALAAIGALTSEGRVAVTGSFAAVRRAPVAAPALLSIYCENPTDVAAALGLLPATTGGNVALLRPFDPVVWERTECVGDVVYAAVSQVAVDCLTGNGRMPAEGEALLGWMSENEGSWRVGSLDEAAASGRRT